MVNHYITIGDKQMPEDYDELDEMIMKTPSEGERVKKEHEMLDRAASHPVRRKIVGSIGAFGRAEAELIDELEIDDSTFKYHMDFLKHANLITTKEGLLRLTDTGIDMLASIQHHRET